MEPPFVVETIAKASTNEKDEATKQLEGDEAEVEKKAPKAPPKRKAAVAEVVEKLTARELFEYVQAEGKKDFIVQTLQRSGRNDRAAALGNHHGS